MKFSQPIVDAVIKDIANDIPYELACESNGISYDLFKLWVRNGKRDQLEGKDSYYARFLTTLREAQKKKIKTHIDNIGFSDKGHKGSEWLLERAHWRYFSAKVADIELNERVSELEGKRANDSETEE